MQSDLEEGEIPEFEVPPPVPERNKKEMVLGSRRVHSLASFNPHDKSKNRPRRYGSPPSEGEYIYEEEKLARKNRILHKHIYKSNLMGKAPKNLHPIQPSYGSVEVLMTKIGESLGRHSDYYYKEIRSKEPRYLVAINDSHNINSVLRKTSPIFKRLEYKCCNKRRHSETNSESVNNIREKCNKIKCKKSFGARRSKKRKRKHSEINDHSTDEVDNFNKLRLFEQKEKGRSERHKRPKKHGLGTRPFKEIPLPQEEEPQTQEKHVKEVKNSEVLNCILDNPKDSLSNMVEESNLGDPPSVILDGDSAVKHHSTHKPEQLNNEDDDDDDDDLIKLRLLALTSNKKKSQSSTNNCLDTVKDIGKSTEEKAIIGSKSNLADEKTRDNPPSNDETVKDNEIDRYELFLRAEALKTALLKKHQRILKKRKTFSAISRNREVTKSENPNGNNLVKRNEIDIDIISDEELFEKNLGCEFGAQLEVTENYEKLEIKNVDKSDSESGKEEKTTDTHQEHGLHSENFVIAVETGHSKKSSISAESGIRETDKGLSNIDIIKRNASTESGTLESDEAPNNVYISVQNVSTESGTLESDKAPNNVDINVQNVSIESGTLESDKALNNVDFNVKNSCVGPQLIKKKAKRIRQKQSKKLDLNETNNKKNNVAFENKDVYQKTNFGYSLSSSDKNKAHLEKKFYLVDSSNPEINAASITRNSQSPFDLKPNYKSITAQKATVLNNEEPTAKIPESERIIVHLGSDSSDEECVPDIEPDGKSRTVVNAESEKMNPLVSDTNENNIKEFERSVELLLSGARRKLEKSAELNSEIPATPEAVYSHLAPSQRLEYMRLKQKIAEREKLGKAEKNNWNNPSTVELGKRKANAIEDNINSPLFTTRNIGKRLKISPNIGDNRALNFKNRVTHMEVGNPAEKHYAIHPPNYGGPGNSKSAPISQFSKIKKPVPELNSQRESASTMRKNLTDSNNALKKGPAEIIIERKKMINQNRLHLERLKILWKNIKIEKMVEAKYEREIKKLKIQQNFFELKVNQQRLKIKRMADESKQIYEAFQKNNKKVNVYGKKKRIVAKAENETQKTGDSVKATTEKNDRKDKYIGNDFMKGKEIGKDIGKEIVKDKVIGKDVVKDKEIGKDVVKDKGIGKDIAKEVIPSAVENDVRLIAEETQIGVNEKREEIGTVAEEKVHNEKKSDSEGTVPVTDKDWLKEYKSPLETLIKGSESSDSPRLDPNVIMCQYDLLGKCNDEECVFQHWRA